MIKRVINGVALEETEAVARKIGAKLFSGAFIALYGGLGAGKTTFTRCMAEQLGITDVASPTFTIVREHEGSLPLFHLDAYRISCSQELFDLGYDDYTARGGVIVMEWPENAAEALPRERLEIAIDGSGSCPRTLTLSAYGAPYEAMLEEIP